MKIKVDIQEDIEETTIHIVAKEYTDEIKEIKKYIESLQQLQEIKGYIKETECYLLLKDILFFETEGREILAFTRDKSYVVKYKLYELEQLLPDYFVRVSKSSIVNVRKIYTINHSFVKNGEIEFQGIHKGVTISRSYYKNFKYVLERRRK